VSANSMKTGRKKKKKKKKKKKGGQRGVRKELDINFLSSPLNSQNQSGKLVGDVCAGGKSGGPHFTMREERTHNNWINVLENTVDRSESSDFFTL